MKLVKFWVEDEVSECLMLLEDDEVQGPNDELIDQHVMNIVEDVLEPNLKRVSWFVIMKSRGSFDLDVHRPYIG